MNYGGLKVATTSNANGMMAAVWGPAYMVVPILGYLSGILVSSIACKCNSGCRVSHAVGVAPGMGVVRRTW